MKFEDFEVGQIVQWTVEDGSVWERFEVMDVASEGRRVLIDTIATSGGEEKEELLSEEPFWFPIDKYEESRWELTIHEEIEQEPEIESPPIQKQVIEI
jgi:hypothetical protein